MSPRNETQVKVNISELLPTPFIVATLVNEIIKGLLFQKCQIPYSYNWLKTAVEKRRKRENTVENTSKKPNVIYENHFRMVSTVYDNINSIMRRITKEFCESGNTILQVIIIFGSTPNCPKEIFTLNMPSIVKGRSKKNHILELNKHLQKVLRNIFLSQSWMDSIDGSITCTNTYIYLKRAVVRSDVSEGFQACQPLHHANHIKQVVFSFHCEIGESSNCCDIHNPDEYECETKQGEEVASNGLEQNINWCRSDTFIKGFKDSFVNKVSVCELW